MRAIFLHILPAAFIACAMFLSAPVSAQDMQPNAPGLTEPVTLDLSESTEKLMDDDGRKVLQGIIEKDELGESMKSTVKNVRSDALKQTAYTLALQKAVKWRYGKIKKVLDEQASRLDQIFDFSPLLMHDGKVLPPAITEAGPGYRVESDTEASSTDVVYEIIRSARMISTAPDWRDYLWRTYPSFTERDVQAGVLPETEKERAMWKQAAVDGWEVGIRQAERLYQNNLNRLTREYAGIVKFRTLAEQDMVSLPVLAEGHPGIEVQGKRLSVDRRIFRITQPSFFQNVDRWEPKIGVDK